MRTLKTALLLVLLATSAHAGKHRVQFDVCAIDPSGKLGVYEVTDKQAKALMIAEYLNDKAHAKGKYFVVVESIDASGDSK